MSFVYVGLGFMAFMAATTLSVDIGMMMTARTQAQTSADAGALAGATALVFNSYSDHSSGGPAVQGAVNTAKANEVIGAPVAVEPDDVTFLNDPAGKPNRVRVQVFRTAARSNPVPTLMASFFGIHSVDIGATATAEASPANAMTCVKPFMVPDKWIEKQTGPWDPTDAFDMFDNKGRLLANPDVYIGDLNSSDYTGYNPDRDKGLLLTIRAGTGNQIYPTMYYSWNMPSAMGGDDYRGNIAGCNTTVVKPKDLVQQEPGDMTGPTNQGIDDLIAKDPNAVWDLDGCNCVRGSAYSQSPRIFPIPVFDPIYYATGKQNGRNADFKVANFIGFFAVKRDGNNIYGRITPILGIYDKNAGPAPDGFFAKVIRLVE